MNRLLLALASAGLLAALVASCTGQAEGDRCQLGNNNDDCQADLVCTQGQSLNRNYDVCCPPPGVAATSDSCKLAPPSPGSDASISDAATDTGVKDTGTSDANDAATSDASDASTSDAGDAAADASAD